MTKPRDPIQSPRARVADILAVTLLDMLLSGKAPPTARPDDELGELGEQELPAANTP